MMTRPTIGFTSLALATLLVPATALAGGGSLTKADFERCNQQAMQVAGISDSESPAASPSTSGSGAGTSGTPGSGTSASPGMTSPSTSGSDTSGSPSTGGTAGTSGSGVSGSGTYSGSGATSATGSADQLKLDRAVQAYRDCLQR